MHSHTGVSNVFVDVSNELVLVETCLSSAVLQTLLEETGRLVVFRGFGGTEQNSELYTILYLRHFLEISIIHCIFIVKINRF